MSAEDQSLLERVEVPSIPKSAAQKIFQLQEQFIRAEVEQRKLPIPFFPVAAPVRKFFSFCGRPCSIFM
jgi:hypothetical protein